MHTHLLCAPSVTTSISQFSRARHESPSVPGVRATCSSQSLIVSLQSSTNLIQQKAVRDISMLRFSRGASMLGVKKRSALMVGIGGRQHVTDPQSKRLKVQARREAKIIPPPGHNVVYRVKEDDTLIGIARHFQCSLEDLVDSNPHLTTDLDFIIEDQHVIIPSHVWTGVTPSKIKGRIEVLAADSVLTAPPEESIGRGQLQYVASIRASNPLPPPNSKGPATGPWSQRGLQVLLLGIGLVVAGLVGKAVKEGNERKAASSAPPPTRSSPPTPPPTRPVFAPSTLTPPPPTPMPPVLTPRTPNPPPLSPPTITASAAEAMLKEDVGSPMKEGVVVNSERDLEELVKDNVGMPRNLGVQEEQTDVQLAEYGRDVRIRTTGQMVRDKAGRLPSSIELKRESVKEGREGLEAMAVLAPAAAGLYFEKVLEEVRHAPSAQLPPPPSPSDVAVQVAEQVAVQVAGAAGKVLDGIAQVMAGGETEKGETSATPPPGPLPTSAELKSLSLGGKTLNPSPEIAPSVAGLYFEQIVKEVRMGGKTKVPPRAGGSGGAGEDGGGGGGGVTSVPLQLEVLTGEGALDNTGPEEDGISSSTPRVTPVAAVGPPPELIYPTNQAVPPGMKVKTLLDAVGNTVSVISMGTAGYPSLAPYKKAAPAAKASPGAGGSVGAVFQNAVPAVVVGVGLSSSISGGPEGAMVMIGLTALLNFALNDLLLADSRKKFWESLRRIQTHEQLVYFLQHRDIIPKA